MPHPALPAPALHPARNGWPLLLSIAHAGRDYPQWLAASAHDGRAALEPLEDPLVDRLAWRALAAGFGAVVALSPRAAIDCNRAEDDLDPALIDGAPPAPAEGRARLGLGLIPSRTACHGPLWRRRLSRADVEARLDQAHRPFHAAIAAALAGLRATHNSALLLDLHSMPHRPGQAQIVVGDRHGSSGAPWLAALAMQIAEGRGFTVAHNVPYAGGHIVARHGRPAANVHALQVEIDRSAYCQRDARTPGPGFERVATLIAALAVGLGEAVAGVEAMAAE